jgi:hypothetical protein
LHWQSNMGSSTMPSTTTRYSPIMEDKLYIQSLQLPHNLKSGDNKMNINFTPGH